VFVSDDEYFSRYLGTAATGCPTWTAQVRPAKLRNDLARFGAEMGLLTPEVRPPRAEAVGSAF
jgi:hypothetical protein